MTALSSIVRFLPLSAALFLCLTTPLRAQNADCPEAKKLSDEIDKLNAEYEKIKADLRAGLYCSKCKLSKTELERSGYETFEQHLADVKGQAIPASQEQHDKAYEKYLSKFNSLKSRWESAVKSCEEKYRQEQERKRLEEERKRKEAERLAEEARKKREQEEKDAAQKRKEAEEAARLKKETEEREAREAEQRREAERQRLLRDQLERDAERRRQMEAEYRQTMLNLQRDLARRPDYNDQILKELERDFDAIRNKRIGAEAQPGISKKPGVSDMMSDKITDMLKEAGPIDEEAFEAMDAAGALKDLYEGGFTKIEEEGIISFFESLGATKPLQYGQTEQLKFMEWGTDVIYEKWRQGFDKRLNELGSFPDYPRQDSEPEPIVPRWSPPSPPPPDDRAAYGQVAFWMMSDLMCHHVDVTILGQSRTITQYYAGGAPGCGASGCANFDLPTGTYSFTARCTDKTWDGSVVITAGGCCMLKLTY